MLEYLENLSKFLDLLELNPHAACKNFTAEIVNARSDVQALQVLALQLKSRPTPVASDLLTCSCGLIDDRTMSINPNCEIHRSIASR